MLTRHTPFNESTLLCDQWCIPKLKSPWLHAFPLPHTWHTCDGYMWSSLSCWLRVKHRSPPPPSHVASLSAEYGDCRLYHCPKSRNLPVVACFSVSDFKPVRILVSPGSKRGVSFISPCFLAFSFTPAPTPPSSLSFFVFQLAAFNCSCLQQNCLCVFKVKIMR